MKLGSWNNTFESSRTEQSHGVAVSSVRLYREDKRLKMGESGARRCPHAALPLNDTSLSYLHKTKGATAASVGGFLFHGSFHAQTFLSTALPCWSRLRGSPRSFHWRVQPSSIWCASAARYTSAAQIKGQRGIHQKELFRKKKKEETRIKMYEM